MSKFEYPDERDVFERLESQSIASDSIQNQGLDTLYLQGNRKCPTALVITRDTEASPTRDAVMLELFLSYSLSVETWQVFVTNIVNKYWINNEDRIKQGLSLNADFIQEKKVNNEIKKGTRRKRIFNKDQDNNEE